MGFVPYIVLGGEYLLQIAHRMAFGPDAVWNADENRELRKERVAQCLTVSGTIDAATQSALASAHGS